jgi:hypothetical protein
MIDWLALVAVPMHVHFTFARGKGAMADAQKKIPVESATYSRALLA